MTLNMPHSSVPLADNNLMSSTWLRFFDELFKHVGNATYSLGGILHVNTTSVGNVGEGEDDLITYDLSGQMLKNENESIEIEAFGTFASNDENKEVKLYLGSTVIFTTGAIAANDSSWGIKARVIRISSGTQLISVGFEGDTTLIEQTHNFVSGSEDLSTSLTIKCTGEAKNDDDIIQKGLLIKYYPGV